MMIRVGTFFFASCVLLQAQLPDHPGAADGGPTSGVKIARQEPALALQTSREAEPVGTTHDPGSPSVPVPAQQPPESIPGDGDEMVRLQIFLDQKHFGPGFIDGKAGMFTRLAMENYNTSLGRAGDDLGLVAESVAAVSDIYATAIVPGFVDDYVDATLPGSKPLQAERTSMPYRSVAEFMAERYHTSEDLLTHLNGAEALHGARARAVLRVPNIEPFRIEAMQPGKSHKPDEHLTARHVVVDTGKKQVYIYRLVVLESPGEATGGAPGFAKLITTRQLLIASFPITPGRTEFIPKGYWNLKNSVELPEWRYDQQLLDTGIRGENSLTIPPGPNNPVGVIWNGLTKAGIGIHGTDNPRTIGRATSAGCIRLANWDAARVPTLVRPGAVVMVK